MRLCVKRSLLTLLFFSLGFSVLGAEEITLPVSEITPIVDGVIDPDEYTAMMMFGSMALRASRGSDGILYIAVVASTEGWVSVGLGSESMDGAHMVMGYSKGDEAVIEEHTAIGHFHKRSREHYCLESAVLEMNEATVLEFALDEKIFLMDGRLPVILAYGNRDSLVTKHKAYYRLTLLF